MYTWINWSRPWLFTVEIIIIIKSSKSELQITFWKTFHQIGESDASR